MDFITMSDDGVQGWLLVAVLIAVVLFANDDTERLLRALAAACRCLWRRWWFARWPLNRRDRAQRRAQAAN